MGPQAHPDDTPAVPVDEVSRTRAGVAAWALAGAALDAARHRELVGMTEADVRTAVAELLALVDGLPLKEGSSGLVDQQRAFARLR